MINIAGTSVGDTAANVLKTKQMCDLSGRKKRTKWLTKTIEKKDIRKLKKIQKTIFQQCRIYVFQSELMTIFQYVVKFHVGWWYFLGITTRHDELTESIIWGSLSF